MQRGFVTLENLYTEKKAQVQSLRRDLDSTMFEYESTVTELVDQLDKNKETIKNLSAEVEARRHEITILSTKVEHVQGANATASVEAKKSVSRVVVNHPGFNKVMHHPRYWRSALRT